MVEVEGELHGAAALEILQTFASCLAKQKEAIASRDWSTLGEIVPELRAVMSRVRDYPDGSVGLRRDLSQLSAAAKGPINDLLESAASNRLASAELIRVNIQRLNALKSLIEHGALDRSESGQLAVGTPGSLLSRRV